MPITRGNPPGMKNVRATVYNHTMSASTSPRA